jgi:hypothetical protein
VAAGRHGGRRRSHYGMIGDKLQPLRAAPADCGRDPGLRRSAAFEPRHRSLPLGNRRKDLGRRRPAPAEEEAADYKPAGDERIQLKRAPAPTSGESTTFSFCNLASSHLMVFQVCHENRNGHQGAVGDMLSVDGRENDGSLIRHLHPRRNARSLDSAKNASLGMTSMSG